METSRKQKNLFTMAYAVKNVFARHLEHSITVDEAIDLIKDCPVDKPKTEVVA